MAGLRAKRPASPETPQSGCSPRSGGSEAGSSAEPRRLLVRRAASGRRRTLRRRELVRVLRNPPRRISSRNWEPADEAPSPLPPADCGEAALLAEYAARRVLPVPVAPPGPQRPRDLYPPRPAEAAAVSAAAAAAAFDVPPPGEFAWSNALLRRAVATRWNPAFPAFVGALDEGRLLAFRERFTRRERRPTFASPGEVELPSRQFAPPDELVREASAVAEPWPGQAAEDAPALPPVEPVENETLHVQSEEERLAWEAVERLWAHLDELYKYSPPVSWTKQVQRALISTGRTLWTDFHPPPIIPEEVLHPPTPPPEPPLPHFFYELPSNAGPGAAKARQARSAKKCARWAGVSTAAAKRPDPAVYDEEGEILQEGPPEVAVWVHHIGSRRDSLDRTRCRLANMYALGRCYAHHVDPDATRKTDPFGRHPEDFWDAFTPPTWRTDNWRAYRWARKAVARLRW